MQFGCMYIYIPVYECVHVSYIFVCVTQEMWVTSPACYFWVSITSRHPDWNTQSTCLVLRAVTSTAGGSI